MPAMLGRPRRRERSTRLREGLRHHTHVCEHRHEIDVADPARHDVQVQVILDPGAGGLAEVEADVVTLRPERGGGRVQRLRQQLPELRALVRVEIPGAATCRNGTIIRCPLP